MGAIRHLSAKFKLRDNKLQPSTKLKITRKADSKHNLAKTEAHHSGEIYISFQPTYTIILANISKIIRIFLLDNPIFWQ